MPDRVAADWISFSVVPAGKATHRILISVPRKAVPLSTRRNRIKRLIREFMKSKGAKPPEGKLWRWMVRKDIPVSFKLQDVVPSLDEKFNQIHSYGRSRNL